MGATEMTAIHGVTMKGLSYDLSNDNEFAALLQDLLNGSLQERPEALQYACGRIKAWLRAHELVSELERTGLLRGSMTERIAGPTPCSRLSESLPPSPSSLIPRTVQDEVS